MFDVFNFLFGGPKNPGCDKCKFSFTVGTNSTHHCKAHTFEIWDCMRGVQIEHRTCKGENQDLQCRKFESKD